MCMLCNNKIKNWREKLTKKCNCDKKNQNKFVLKGLKGKQDIIL